MLLLLLLLLSLLLLLAAVAVAVVCAKVVYCQPTNEPSECQAKKAKSAFAFIFCIANSCLKWYKIYKNNWQQVLRYISKLIMAATSSRDSARERDVRERECEIKCAISEQSAYLYCHKLGKELHNDTIKILSINRDIFFIITICFKDKLTCNYKFLN